MNKIIIVTITCFLMLCYGCKKESEDENWTINEIVVTFRLEYNSTEQLNKYSKLRNSTLFSFYTFDYSDTSVIQKHFDQNSKEIEQTIYVLDSNFRAIKSYSNYETNNADTIIYSPSGFLSSIIVGNSYSFSFVDNGADIISESVDMLFTTYNSSEILSKVSVPNDYCLNVVPSFTGAFGKTNQHLLNNYSTTISGVGGRTVNCRFEYRLDSEGYVTEVKKYQKSTPRYQNEAEYGTISYVKYEYIFE